MLSKGGCPLSWLGLKKILSSEIKLPDTNSQEQPKEPPGLFDHRWRCSWTPCVTPAPSNVGFLPQSKGSSPKPASLSWRGRGEHWQALNDFLHETLATNPLLISSPSSPAPAPRTGCHFSLSLSLLIEAAALACIVSECEGSRETRPEHALSLSPLVVGYFWEKRFTD